MIVHALCQLDVARKRRLPQAFDRRERTTIRTDRGNS